MLTAIYLRKSRADEDALTVEETLRRHKETLLEFAARQPDMQIYQIYEDVVSGDRLYARPQMLRLLEDAENELFDAVLCMDIDRLGRGATSEQGLILETFKNHDIRIITPRKVYDLNNDIDEEYAEFESFMARRELKTIKRRLHNGTLKSLQEGCYLVNAPYGYKNCKVNKKATLEIYEPEAQFVRMAFDLYLTGVGTQAIAHTLNSLGAKPHRSNQFNRTSVAAMLRNQVYIGKVVWNKKKTLNRGAADKKIQTVYHDKSEWMIYDGLHPAIIDEKTFERVNEILSSRYHKPYNDGTIVNPLGGVLKCAKCGYGMQRRPYQANRKYQTTHLLCSTKGCCTSSRIDYVEESVINNIIAKLNELRVARNENKPVSDLTAVLDGIDKELAALDTQKNSLHDLLERGIYDVDTYVSRQNIIKARRDELLRERDNVTTKQQTQSSEHLDALIKNMENLIATYWDASAPQRNKMLKEVLDGGTYYKERGWAPNQFTISLNFKGL